MNIRLTNHAVQRFQERIRPGLDLPAARKELMRLLRYAEERPRPEGMLMDSEPDAWVSIGPDVWMPCVRRPDGVLIARSVIANHGVSDIARQRRNAARRERKAERRRANISRSRGNVRQGSAA